VLAKQHSGSIRYYAGRPTLRWDVLEREWLDRALADLRRAGYTPFVVLDPDEEPEFRERFGTAGQTALDRMWLVATVARTRVIGFDE
jgi:hypothetical protein